MKPEVLRAVRAKRLSTVSGEEADEECLVAVERPLAIEVAGRGRFTLLCTPDDRRALAVGFLLSEGIVDRAQDIAAWSECGAWPDLLLVELAASAPAARAPQASGDLVIASSGQRGSEDLMCRFGATPAVGDTLRVPRQVLRAASRAVLDSQPVFRQSGGTHAIGIFDAAGALLGCAEDIGRHNALDKAIGKCLLAGVETAGRGAALSGRVSLEMVGKCARAGIELISAVSAPTSLAIEAAERWGITLCAFVRDTRATVFTHARRVTG